MNDPALDFPTIRCCGVQRLKFDVRIYRWANLFGFGSLCHCGCDRRKHITSMKCFAGWMAKELFVSQVMRAPVPFALAYPTKDSVVRTDEELICAFDQYGVAI